MAANARENVNSLLRGTVGISRVERVRGQARLQRIEELSCECYVISSYDRM